MTVVAQNTSVKTTKLAIPHPLAENCTIVGTLEQVSPEEDTHGRKIALVCMQAVHLFRVVLRARWLQILHGSMG